jgi:hypothetical protein
MRAVTRGSMGDSRGIATSPTGGGADPDIARKIGAESS